MSILNTLLAKYMPRIIAWYNARMAAAFDRDAYFHHVYEQQLADALRVATLYRLARAERVKFQARADGGNRVVAGNYVGDR